MEEVNESTGSPKGVGRPPIATAERVAAAARILERDGKERGVRAIHRITGGAFKTISAALKNLPPATQTVSLNMVMTDQYTKALKALVDSNVAELQRQFQRSLDEANERARVMEDTALDIETKLLETERNIDQLRREHNELVGRYQSERDAHERTRYELIESKAKQSASELASARMDEDRISVRDRNLSLESEVDRLREQQKTTQQELNDYKVKLAKTEVWLEQANEKVFALYGTPDRSTTVGGSDDDSPL